MGDTQCWEYVFRLDPSEFIQQGTEETPLIYWLDVQAQPLEEGPMFGWKTSLDHWNDDAVWAFGPEPPPTPWTEMHYPPMHPMEPMSIDLAFTIIGQEQSGPTGACCRGASCSITTQAMCLAGGGYYVGDGQPCTPDPCCCAGPSVGNVDGSADNLVTMGDLTVLIDHLFISLNPLNCWPEGNVDLSSDYLVTMADLTVLIDHLFISLNPLPPCPW